MSTAHTDVEQVEQANTAFYEAMERGMLALGSEQCIAGVHVAGLLAAFRRRHPDVEICLRQAGAGALADEVAAGRLDLAFAVRTERADSDQLRFIVRQGKVTAIEWAWYID